MNRWDLVGVGLVLAFGLALGALLQRDEMPDASAEAIFEPGEGLVAGEAWMGLYFKGKKVGLLHLDKRRRPGGWAYAARTLMKLSFTGSLQTIDMRVKARLDEALTLQDFDFSVESGPANLKGSGVVEGTELTLKLDTGGGSETRTMALSRPPALQASLAPLISQSELTPGTSKTFAIFDPLTQTEQTVEVTVKGRETLAIMGEPVEAIKLEQRLMGASFDTWINARGEVLKQNLTLGLVAVRETEEAARWGLSMGPLEAVDLFERTLIPVEGLPPRLKDRSRLTLTLTGASLEGFELERPPRQIFAPERAEVTVVREPVGSGLPRPVAAEGDYAHWLRPEPLMQVDHPRIQEAARAAAGKATDTVGAARNIMAWVHSRLRQQNVVGVPSALETLRAGVGDCNEHSVLFAALARAAGVPTRVVVGVVYQHGRFGYHAWNEVATAEGWVSVDATWDQMPADVGHLAFVSGGLSRQVEMVRIIGQLGLEVR